MEYLRNGLSALHGSWKIPIRLNGKTTGIIALEELACSILLIAQKAYSLHDYPTPRIDHVVHLLTSAKQIMRHVPLTLTCLDDTLRALQKLAQRRTPAAICKNIAFLTGLSSQVIGLLEFIDQHGGHTVATIMTWDQKYLGGRAASLGSSRLFTLFGITTLASFRNALTITSALFAITHVGLTYRRKIYKYELEIQRHGLYSAMHPMQVLQRNRKLIGLYRGIQAEKRTLYSLRVANGVCNIASVFIIGSTLWPALGFGVVSAVLLVSQELYKRNIDDKKKEVNKMLLE